MNDKDSVVIDIVTNIDLQKSQAKSLDNFLRSISKLVAEIGKEVGTIGEKFEKSPRSFYGHMGDIRNTLKSVRADMSTVNHELGHLRNVFSDFGETSTAFKSAEASVQQYKARLDELYKLQKSYESQLATGTRLTGTQTEIDEANNQYDLLSNSLRDLSLTYDDIRTKIDENKVKRGEELTNIKLEREKQAELTKQLEEGSIKRSHYNKLIRESNRDIETSQLRIAALNTANQKLGGQQSQTNSKMKLTRQELGKVSAELERLRTPVQFTDEEIQLINKNLNDTTTEIKDIETALKSISTSGLDYLNKAIEENPQEAARILEFIQSEAETAASRVNEIVEARDRLTEWTSPKEVTEPIEEIGETSEKVSASVGRMSNRFDRLKRIISSVRSIFRTLNSIFKNIFSTIKRLINKLTGLIKKLTSLFKISHKNGSAFKSLDKFASRLFKRFIQFGLGVRSVYFLVRKMRTAFIDAFKAMAEVVPEANDAVSRMTILLTQLKGTLAAVFQPIASVGVPVLERFAGSLTDSMNTFAEFIATLTGQGYIYKYTAGNYDYAESLKETADAAEEAKKKLAEYDNLLVITDDDASNSSKNKDKDDYGITSGTWEKVFVHNDFADKIRDLFSNLNVKDLGTTLTTKLVEALKKIKWPKIKFQARKIGTKIGSFITGVFSTPNLGETIGHTLAQAINTGINFLGGLSDSINWKAIATTVRDAIKTFLTETHFAEAGKNLSELILGALGAALEIVTDKEAWELFGKDLRDFFENLEWGKIIGQSIEIGANLLVGLLLSITNYLASPDAAKKFAEIVDSLEKVLEELPWDDVIVNLINIGAMIITELSHGLAKLLNSGKLTEAAQKIGHALGAALKNLPWEEILSNIMGIIDFVFETIGAALEELFNLPEGTGKAVAEALAIGGLAIAITVKLLPAIAQLIGAFKGKNKQLGIQTGLTKKETDAETDLGNAFNKSTAFGAGLVGILGALAAGLFGTNKQSETAAEAIGNYATETVTASEVVDGSLSAIENSYATHMEGAYSTVRDKMYEMENEYALQSLNAYNAVEANNAAIESSYATHTSNASTATANNLNLINTNFSLSAIAIASCLGVMVTGFTQFGESIQQVPTTVGNALQQMQTTVQTKLFTITQTISSWSSSFASQLGLAVSTVVGLILSEFTQFGENLQQVPSKVGTALQQMRTSVQEKLPTIGQTISSWASSFVSSVGTVVSTAIATVLTTLPLLGKNAVEALGQALSFGFEAVRTFFNELGPKISTWFDNAFASIGSWFSYTSESIGSWFSSTGEAIGSWFLSLGESIGSWFSNVASSTSTVFSNIWTGITNWLSSAWSVIVDVWERAKQGILDSTYESVLSGHATEPQDYQNYTILDFLGITDLKNLFTPGSFSHAFGTIPGFASGTVVPPNKEFLAVLGDNKTEPEIVSPLSTMKQALAEVLAEMGTTSQMPEKIQIVMPNGKVLAETVWDEERKLYKQTGTARFA